MLLSVLVAIFAIFLGWVFYERRPELPRLWAERFKGAYRLIAGKYLVDELYGRILLAPYYALCRAAAWVHRNVLRKLLSSTRSHSSSFISMSEFKG